MSHLPANWSPPEPPPPPPSEEPRSLWKPIGITLVTTFVLSMCTCAGGLSIGKRPDGIGSLLLYSGLIFLGLFVLTLNVALVYFLIWIIQRMVKR